jgi:gliding motility-associated-like protein
MKLLSCFLFLNTFNIVYSQCSRLCNSDFEANLVTLSSGQAIVNETFIDCWKTTATDHMIEVWADGFLGVNALNGQQFIELNANEISTIYQEFTVIEGEILTIQFGHRGRFGSDVIGLEIGPTGGPFQDIGVFSSGNLQWSEYTATYFVPIGLGTDYTIRFNSINSAGGNQSAGNFLDAIQISTSGELNITPTLENKNCMNNGGGIEILLTGQIGNTSVSWEPNVGSGLSIQNLETGTYTVTIQDELGCIIIDTFEIEETIATVVSQFESICEYETYNFFDTIISTQGTFYHTIFDAIGCDSLIYALTVNVLSSPNLSFTVSPEVVNMVGQEITITNLSSGGTNYQWQIGNDSFINNSVSFIYVGDEVFYENGMVTLIADSLGCSDTLTQSVLINVVHFLDVPNVFTPNNDGVNDDFILVAKNIDDFKITILNRWGNQISNYSGDVHSYTWDGTYNGTKVPDGNYFYVIEYSTNKNKIERSGHITLLRK